MTQRLIRQGLGSLGSTKAYFDAIGLFRRWIANSQRDKWRDVLREMSRHLPPGSAELKVLDVGAGPGDSTLQLLEFRLDLCILSVDFSARTLRLARRAGTYYQDCVAWAQADVTKLPARDNSFDAVTAHNIYSMLEEHPAFLHAFLRETLRVLRPGGRLIMLDPAQGLFGFLRRRHRSTLAQVAAHLNDAGYARVLSERVADGAGILSRGEKPYPALNTVERIAQTAAHDDVDSSNDALQIVDAANLANTIRGRFVFVLVRQTPDKPVWAIQPGEAIRWQAAMVNDERNKPYLLAFASLSKAVAFMQPAVTGGVLQGINKVGKFEKHAAAKWSADVLINPAFETLRTSSQFTFKGVQMDVDPASAVSGEE